MAKAARRENITPDEIAEKYINIYKKDIALLNALPATHDPKATDYIQDMIAMVEKLIETGHAYITDQAVYFDVSTYPDYTKLSGQKLEKLEEGEGHGSISDSNKKNPQDFSLWFFKTGSHANALQTWDSPFASPSVKNGRGFPGWHIECSAMSKHFLGPTFDIHMGGIEHIPIHHTNEIAQSTCANDAQYVDYWLHNEHLLVDNKKMAKSEGTSYSLADIIEKGFNPLALRYFFTQSHYRSKQNFTWEGLQSAQTALEKLFGLYQELGVETGNIDEKYKEEFLKSINDDFNVPQAVAVVWDLAKDSKISNADKKATLLDFDKVLGFGFNKIQKIEIPEAIEKLAEEREKARKSGDFKKSDDLRDKIKKLGFEIKDTPGGYKITK
jgi:cysteinyl-tRNA synthetase